MKGEFHIKVVIVEMGIEDTIKYMRDLKWQEVSMIKALNMWSKSKRHIKCEVDNSTHFYHGQEPMKRFEHDQVTDGRWFVEVK